MDKKNIVIVTGASSGLGKEFIRLLNNDVNIDEIYALARNKDRLENLIKEFGEKIKTYIIDLSNIEEIKNFGSYLEELGVNVKILINSAGFAKFCSYDDISIEESVNMIDLNISGLVSMGLVCIPYMGKDSHIINIASQAAFQPVPYMNIYSATKSFVKNYSQALNIELKKRGITVTVACPGWMKTNLFERGNIGAEKSPKYFYGITNPDIVAKKVLKDAYKRKDISIYGSFVNICVFFAKYLPEKIIMKIWLFMQRIK